MYINIYMCKCKPIYLYKIYIYNFTLNKNYMGHYCSHRGSVLKCPLLIINKKY